MFERRDPPSYNIYQIVQICVVTHVYLCSGMMAGIWGKLNGTGGEGESSHHGRICRPVKSSLSHLSGNDHMKSHDRILITSAV